MTASERPRILYLGPFRLPDRNAAAQRVIANAKGLRMLGYEVILAQVGQDERESGQIERLPDVEGFACFRLPMGRRRLLEHPQLSVRPIAQLLDQLPSPLAIVAYNYPAVALARLIGMCRRRGLACTADVTEWYGTAHLSSRVRKLVKSADTFLRMRFLHRRLDALMVISKYLEDYYSGNKTVKVVRVPPLVDMRDDKWRAGDSHRVPGALSLVFAGSASAEKERLDLTVDAVEKAAQEVAVTLDVVGLTVEEFHMLYPGSRSPNPEYVTFHGRVSHQEALARVSAADFSVIVRDHSRVTEAGFPTKFVESISLGTRVLATPHPDLSQLLSDRRNGGVVELGDLATQLREYARDREEPDRSLFDFRNYKSAFLEFASALGRPK